MVEAKFEAKIDWSQVSQYYVVRLFQKSELIDIKNFKEFGDCMQYLSKCAIKVLSEHPKLKIELGVIIENEEYERNSILTVAQPETNLYVRVIYNISSDAKQALLREVNSIVKEVFEKEIELLEDIEYLERCYQLS